MTGNIRASGPQTITPVFDYACRQRWAVCREVSWLSVPQLILESLFADNVSVTQNTLHGLFSTPVFPSCIFLSSLSLSGVLCLLEHDEEYVFTLPCAYARSILTVPWVELGGKVTISCVKSGYSATVTFHTKPFYGGKVHR